MRRRRDACDEELTEPLSLIHSINEVMGSCGCDDDEWDEDDEDAPVESSDAELVTAFKKMREANLALVNFKKSPAYIELDEAYDAAREAYRKVKRDRANLRQKQGQQLKHRMRLEGSRKTMVGDVVLPVISDQLLADIKAYLDKWS